MGIFKFLFSRKKSISPLAYRKYGENEIASEAHSTSVLASKKYGKTNEEDLPTFARVDFSKRPQELEEAIKNDTYEYGDVSIAARANYAERYRQAQEEASKTPSNDEICK